MITECRCGGSFNSNRCDSCGLDPHEPQYSYFQFASAIATEREKAAKDAIEAVRKVGRGIQSGEEFNEYHGLIVEVIEALEAAAGDKE